MEGEGGVRGGGWGVDFEEGNVYLVRPFRGLLGSEKESGFFPPGT